jgi:hypothetical protein
MSEIEADSLQLWTGTILSFADDRKNLVFQLVLAPQNRDQFAVKAGEVSPV